MFNRVATLTVIRGNGDCIALMNGIVKEEIVKMNERHALEMSRKQVELDTARGTRNAMRQERLEAYRELDSRPKSAFKRLLEPLETFWCVLWAFGEHFGCWEYAGDDENKS